MIVPGIVGPAHQMSIKQGGMPFAVGQVDPAKGPIHVLDDTTLDILLGTLDAITDFVRYLSKKEKFISSGQRVATAAGEEELLAYYLKDLNAEGEHDFLVPDDIDLLSIDEGFRDAFSKSEARRAQIAANSIGYSWDALIETFNIHILGGTQYRTNPFGVSGSERIMRFLAREPSTRRRMLAKAIVGLIGQTPKNYSATRVIAPSKPGDPYYVFLLLPPS